MILKLEELTKLYKDKVALDSVSFSFSPGEYMGFWGRMVRESPL